MKTRKLVLTSIVVGTALLCALPFLADLRRNARAADHFDAPSLAHDAGADLADAFLFLDPADTNRVIMILTIRGFISAGENGNFGFFDPAVRYRLELERTGDEKVDDTIDVTFGPRTSPSVGQVATVKLPGKNNSFTAPCTPSSLAATAPAPVLFTNAAGVIFFAGLVDDPFFFDIPGFNRFVASVLAGTPDPTRLNRGRDSFAGYNIMAFALSLPVDLVRPEPSAGNVLGLTARAQRRVETFNSKGELKATGGYKNVDRIAVPAVNVALIPFALKNRYNVAKQTDDAKGEFAPAILATLTALGTSAANQGLLASVAVAKGDFLRLNLTIPNSGSGRGLPAGTVPDAFPNGRRLSDDTVDILLELITNGAITNGDNVDTSDIPLRSTFPFLAPPQQPRENPPGGVLADDNTRN